MRLAALLALVLPPLAAQRADKNPFESPADTEVGRRYFLGHCAYCHGPEGEGGRGANLTSGQYRQGSSDRDLYRVVRNGVAGSEMPPSRLSESEIWKVVLHLRRLGSAGAQEKAAGDPPAGRAVYDGKGACGACHAIAGRGGSLGPDLSRIGLLRTLKFLRAALTDPDAFVDEHYQTITVLTRSGEKVSGIRLNEDDYSVQIRDLREVPRSFLKREVKEVRREKGSLMPAYGATLSAAEMEDLVAYLSSLRGTS